jgi:hypothetical protein
VPAGVLTEHGGAGDDGSDLVLGEVLGEVHDIAHVIVDVVVHVDQILAVIGKSRKARGLGLGRDGLAYPASDGTVQDAGGHAALESTGMLNQGEVLVVGKGDLASLEVGEGDQARVRSAIGADVVLDIVEIRRVGQVVSQGLRVGLHGAAADAHVEVDVLQVWEHGGEITNRDFVAVDGEDVTLGPEVVADEAEADATDMLADLVAAVLVHEGDGSLRVREVEGEGVVQHLASLGVDLTANMEDFGVDALGVPTLMAAVLGSQGVGEALSRLANLVGVLSTGELDQGEGKGLGIALADENAILLRSKDIAIDFEAQLHWNGHELRLVGSLAANRTRHGALQVRKAREMSRRHDGETGGECVDVAVNMLVQIFKMHRNGEWK